MLKLVKGSVSEVGRFTRQLRSCAKLTSTSAASDLELDPIVPYSPELCDRVPSNRMKGVQAN